MLRINEMKKGIPSYKALNSRENKLLKRLFQNDHFGCILTTSFLTKPLLNSSESEIDDGVSYEISHKEHGNGYNNNQKHFLPDCLQHQIILLTHL